MGRIKFMNTEIDNLTMDEALKAIDSLILQRKNSYVVTPNVDHIVQLERNEELLNAYKKADLILADGKPLLWISKLYKTPIKEKVSGSDLFPKICELAVAKGYTLFFLGADVGVAELAAKKLRKKYNGLKIVGTFSPPLEFEKSEGEIRKIRNIIKSATPDILIVGLGCPKQELFIFHNYEKLGVPISLGLGATIDFEAGKIRRAPEWMSKSGLEWLFRLIQDPRRMIKRYIFNDTKILSLIVKYWKKKE